MTIGRLRGLAQQQEELADAAHTRTIGSEEHGYRGEAKLSRVAPGLEVFYPQAIQHLHDSVTRAGILGD